MAAASERHAIERRGEDLPEEVQEFLADDLYLLESISNLADELSIVALYRVVEINTRRILAHKFGPKAARKASYIRQLQELLKQNGILLERIPHYRAMNELRLLNNAVKHAGYGSPELAEQYSRWRRFKHKELVGLDDAYERLKTRVPSYILRLAERLRLRYSQMARQ